MHQMNETRPRGQSGERAPNLSFGGDRKDNKEPVIKNQAEPCPIEVGLRSATISDLLGEALEIDGAYGFAILKAIREGDDAAILEAFRLKDAAHRTARRCAEDLRRTIGLAPSGAAQ